MFPYKTFSHNYVGCILMNSKYGAFLTFIIVNFDSRCFISVYAWVSQFDDVNILANECKANIAERVLAIHCAIECSNIYDLLNQSG